MENRYVIGLDYGTDSARALVVEVETGKIIASSVKYYPRWKQGLYCCAAENRWRQHPLDYILLHLPQGCQANPAGSFCAQSTSIRLIITTGRRFVLS